MALFTHTRTDDMAPPAPFFQLSEEQLQALHPIILESLSDVANFCDQHKLTYVLAYGSCLGAIRHHNLIPWDDDADIAMPRKDFDSFIKLFPAEMGDRYSLDVPGVTKRYSRDIAKVRRRGTHLGSIEETEREDAGVFIDVFILETAPATKIGAALHGLGSIALRALVYFRRLFEWKQLYMLVSSNNPEHQRDTKRRIALGRLLSFAPMETWVKWWDQWNGMFRTQKAKQFVTTTDGDSYWKRTFAVEDYLPPAQAQLGDRLFNVPANYKTYLARCFGPDYLELPQESQRRSHVFLKYDLGSTRDPQTPV